MGLVVRFGMANPEVSVGIVSFNQREFLRECIESCLEQDFDSFEIVVADNASTDGSQELLKQFCKSHPGKVRAVLQSVNKGITANSNDLLRACRGKYVAFMGGDDLMIQGKLSSQFEFMEENSGCAICYHDLDVFDSESGASLYRFNANSAPEGKIAVSIREGCFNGACSTFVRVSAMPPEGFDERIPVASDWLFWVDTLSSGGEIRFLPKVLGRYRRHGSNVTASPKLPARAFNQAVLDHLVSCQIILQKYPQHSSFTIYRYLRILFSALGAHALSRAVGVTIVRGVLALTRKLLG